MADNKLISKVTLGGVTYDLKDKYAREKLLALEGVVTGGVQIKIVNELPTASRNTVGKIYFISHTHSEKDIYDEYLTIIGGTEETPTYFWEKIGNTDIDLSGYAKKTDIPKTLPASDVYAWAKASTKPSYTASEVGLGNVPNVTTNDQTPSYTEATTLAKLTSGEKLSVAFGKISKAITDLISHIGDSVKHITSTERTNWGTAYNHSQSSHAPADAQKNVQSDWNATSGDAFIKNKPSIPSEITEDTVSGWGFTKNTGTYSKPSTGIPKTDLASAVQTSLGKADTALQSFTETDPTVPAWAKASSKPSYTASEVGALANTVTHLSGDVPTTRKVNGKALSADITLTASDVGADASGSASSALASAKSYTDTEIANLVGTAPETMDTLEEVAQAIKDHQDVTDALNAAIGNKVDKVSGKGLSTNDLTNTLKSNYDSAYTHSQSTHARTDATKVEKSSTNGNIKINGTETTVYTHPSGTNPHGTTKSDVGLGNVDNTADASKNVKSSKKLQTYKQGSATETYGDNYPIYAQWRDSTHVKMKCDNYTVETDYATTAGNADTATSATKATQDESGNNIKSSYASSISISDHTITLKNKNGTSLGTVTVPDNNTTYSSKAAASGGTDVSLVTTGEKYTWNNKANASHGNHVPTTGTADNATFLRNDNTWQKVTPANIGAAASSHTHSSYVNQNAFSNVVVGSTTVAADSATDTLTLVAGSNVTITPDATNDKITIAATDTNTWRGIQNNLTSDSTTDSLSAAQGKVLKGLVDGKVENTGTGVSSALYKLEIDEIPIDADSNACFISSIENNGTFKRIPFSSLLNKVLQWIISAGMDGNVRGVKVNNTTKTPDENGTVDIGTFLTAHPTISTSTDSTSTSSPKFGETFTAVDSVTRDSNGHVTKVNTKTVTLPNNVVTIGTNGLMHSDDKYNLEILNSLKNILTTDNYTIDSTIFVVTLNKSIRISDYTYITVKFNHNYHSSSYGVGVKDDYGNTHYIYNNDGTFFNPTQVNFDQLYIMRVTGGYLNIIETIDLNQLVLSTISNYGLAKISTSTAVTSYDTGLVLSVVEKNPNVSGSLAATKANKNWTLIKDVSTNTSSTTTSKSLTSYTEIKIEGWIVVNTVNCMVSEITGLVSTFAGRGQLRLYNPTNTAQVITLTINSSKSSITTSTNNANFKYKVYAR